ncbi:MAG: hypothetical protein ABI946_04360 [Chthoniobacterales bacterium]
MAAEVYTHRTEPDEDGNVFHIESPREIVPRIIFETIAWYKSEPHHAGFSEPERNKHIWISVVEAAGGAHRGWRYLPDA